MSSSERRAAPAASDRSPSAAQARSRELEGLQPRVEELQAQMVSMEGTKGWLERHLKEAEVISTAVSAAARKGQTDHTELLTTAVGGLKVPEPTADRTKHTTVLTNVQLTDQNTSLG